MKLKRVFGQLSWRVASDDIEAYVTELGGHLGPVTFGRRGRKCQPFSVAPWAEEKHEPGTPTILRVLRGDFFCLPFGGNATPFRGERHPVHGETANSKWKLKAQSTGYLHLSLRTKSRPGRVDKHLWVSDAIYCRHVITGMRGPMSFGHHAMLKFRSPGAVTTSRFVHAQVLPTMFETPEQRGYQSLKPGAPFRSLNRVPLLAGGFADLSRYPARRGFEDLVMLVNDARQSLAWTAVTFPQERYVWFALKDPRVLRETIFWLSNGGRHLPPWNGRHVDVMGLEEVTSYFHYGLAESARRNPLSAEGHATSHQLDPGEPTVVNYILATAGIPAGFDQVVAIKPNASGSELELVSRNGLTARTSVNLLFLNHQPTDE